MESPRYRFGAVDVDCDVDLPGYARYRLGIDRPAADPAPGMPPTSRSGRPRIVVHRSPHPAPAGIVLARLPTSRGPIEIRAAGDAQVVAPMGLAPYTLSPGRLVDWHLPGDPSTAETDHLVATALPWVLARGPGTRVLHAAALVGPAGAVLVCGRSGAGKSTLGTALHQRLGWPLLGDDAAVLLLADPTDTDQAATAGPGPARVLSCSREVRLWDDAGRMLGLGGGIPLPRYGTKSRHTLAGEAAHPVPIAAVVRIDRRDDTRAVASAPTDGLGARAAGGPAGDGTGPGGSSGAAPADPVALTPLRPVEGLPVLRANLLRCAPATPGETAAEFAFLTRWAQGVRFATLSYHHAPAALDEAVRLLAGFAAPPAWP